MYHSEYGQDKFVADLLGHKRNGTFVEFGALDGLLHSNSLYFERELGWLGLLIEANPDAFTEMSWKRPAPARINAAVYDRAGTVSFEKFSGKLLGWSGIKAEVEPQHRVRIEKFIGVHEQEVIEVPCVTLQWALDFWHGGNADGAYIDYMSIDVEGAELKILSVFPFEKFNIDVLGVEDNFGNVELDALIQSRGYQFLQKVGPDRMYRLTK